MQETARENYRVRSLSAPGMIVESALQYSEPPQREQSHPSQLLVVSDESSSSISAACTELGQELVAVSAQIGERDDSRIREIVTRIVEAFHEEPNVESISTPFFDAIESIINRRMNVDTFINVMVFCIRLVRRYRTASLSNWQEKTTWVTKQIYELMESAYERYHIDDWIREQGGWNGVLQLVRARFQTFSDYVIQGRGFTRRQSAIAGASVIALGVGAVAIIVWYNW